MSNLDHLTDAKLTAAGWGIMVMGSALLRAGIHSYDLVDLTPDMKDGLDAIIACVEDPTSLAGGPNSDSERAAAEQH